MKAMKRSTDAAARWSGAAFALGLHALMAVAVLSYAPVRTALLSVAPIMVSLVSPPMPAPRPKPAVATPPPPRPVARPRPPEPPPVLTAPVDAPSLVSASPPPPEPPPPAPAPAPVAVPVVVVTPPVFDADYLDNPAPEYPRLARRNGEQGRVVLRVLVNAAGRADDIEVRTSSGHLRLDQAARNTVRSWRFVPARRGDDPVPAWVLIPISFRLEG